MKDQERTGTGKRCCQTMTAGILVVTIAVVMAFGGCGAETAQTPKLTGSCIDILSEVYETAELDTDLREAMQYYDTATIDESMETYILGTDEVDYTDSAYSAPMMSSVAYQCVILRLEEDADVVKAKQTLRDHADPAKWICVEADTVVVESVGDVILYVMADKDTANAIKDAFLALGES